MSGQQRLTRVAVAAVGAWAVLATVAACGDSSTTAVNTGSVTTAKPTTATPSTTSSATDSTAHPSSEATTTEPEAPTSAPVTEPGLPATEPPQQTIDTNTQDNEPAPDVQGLPPLTDDQKKIVKLLHDKGVTKPDDDTLVQSATLACAAKKKGLDETYARNVVNSSIGVYYPESAATAQQKADIVWNVSRSNYC